MALQEWNCHRCTYLHKYPSQRCSMCGALRVSRRQMLDFVAGKRIDGSETMSPPKRARVAEEATEAGEVVDLLESPETAVGAAASPPRRLGLLQCPNAGSLGWGGSATATNDGSGNPTESAKAKVPVEATVGISDVKDGPMPLHLTDENEAGPKNDDDVESPSAKTVGDGTKQQVAENVEPVNGDAPKSNALKDSAMHTACDVNEVYAHSISIPEEEPSETKEPMKGAVHEGESNAEPIPDATKPLHMSVALDYEPMTDASIGRSQILTIAYHGRNMADTNEPNSTTVVGKISGRARLEVLPEEDAPHSSSPTLSLDVFGYRINPPRNKSNENDAEVDSAIVINRPDWMHSLPISVVCQNVQITRSSPIVLRVRVQSIIDEKDDASNDVNGGVGGCYYSAYPQESYELDVLPPNALRPGNYTAAGSGVCTILPQWKGTLDGIAGVTNPPGKVDGTKSRENHDRILLCGAKGVGKSTLLRYAANRIMSSTSHRLGHLGGNGRVAVLDLDCGQPELSPPGMLSLTIVSKPLLSDPPVHMVCGGSCDHHGQKIDSEESKCSSKHESAYFFGDITSKADPDTYIQMTTQLIQRYEGLKGQPGNDSLPLLINTDGWVKGLGYELLSAIIGAVNPGHIIQIMGNTKVKSFDMSSHGPGPISTSDPRRRSVHVLQSFDESLLPSLDDDNRSNRSIGSSASTGPLLASASDHRDHRLCAYLLGGHDRMTKLRSQIPGEHEAISFHKERGLYDPHNIVGLTLASMRPYAVPFRCVKVYPPPGLLDGASELRPEWGIQGHLACSDVLDSLNGSIVGLCSQPDVFDAPLSRCNAGTGVPVLNCVGLGVLRSIDHARKLFFVLSPVHPQLLKEVTSFVGGSINLPLECVYRGVHSDSFPFLSCGQNLTSTSIGADVMKNRSHTRRGSNR